MNKKTIMFITIIGILFLAICLIFVLTRDNEKQKNGKEDVYTKLSDEEFLYTIHEWEKEGSPNNVWVFNEDGTGKVTTDGKEYFDWNWMLKDGHIVTITKWLYDISDDYPITFDKKNISFTITKDENKITYVKKTTE